MTARFHVHVLGVLVIIYACNAYYSKYVEISCCCCWFFVCFFPARLLSIRNVLWCSVLHAMLCCVVWCCHAKGSISVHVLVSKCLNRASHTHTHTPLTCIHFRRNAMDILLSKDSVRNRGIYGGTDTCWIRDNLSKHTICFHFFPTSVRSDGTSYSVCIYTLYSVHNQQTVPNRNTCC